MTQPDYNKEVASIKALYAAAVLADIARIRLADRPSRWTELPVLAALILAGAALVVAVMS